MNKKCSSGTSGCDSFFVDNSETYSFPTSHSFEIHWVQSAHRCDNFIVFLLYKLKNQNLIEKSSKGQ